VSPFLILPGVCANVSQMGMTSYMFQEHDKLQGVANVGNKTAWAGSSAAELSDATVTA
jgi:hypothetical protein